MSDILLSSFCSHVSHSMREGASECALLSTEEYSFLLLLPLCPMDPPTGACYQKHDQANYQQHQGYHFGLKQGVEGESNTCACHAYNKGYDSKRKNTAVPGLFCSTCGLS